MRNSAVVSLHSSTLFLCYILQPISHGITSQQDGEVHRLADQLLQLDEVTAATVAVEHLLTSNVRSLSWLDETEYWSCNSYMSIDIETLIQSIQMIQKAF